MTQELRGGGSRLKNKVKEIGALAMHYLRVEWRWD